MDDRVKVYSAKFEIGIQGIRSLAARSIYTMYRICQEALHEKFLKPLEAKIMVNARADGHTLKELRRLGHPYSRNRYPQIHVDEPWKVHQQTSGIGPTMSIKGEKTPAEILNETQSRLKAGAIGSALFSFSLMSSSIITAYLEFGTDRMHERPFAEEMIKRQAPEIRDYIRQNFRVAK